MPSRRARLANHFFSLGVFSAAVAVSLFVHREAATAAERAALASARGQAVGRMEAESLAVVLATLGHLHDRDPRHLARLETARAGFAEAIRAYHGGATDLPTRDRAGRAEAGFQQLASDAEALLGHDRAVTERYPRFDRRRVTASDAIGRLARDVASGRGGHPKDWAASTKALGEAVEALPAALRALHAEARPAKSLVRDADDACRGHLLALDGSGVTPADREAVAALRRLVRDVLEDALAIRDDALARRERAERFAASRASAEAFFAEIRAASALEVEVAAESHRRGAGIAFWGLAASGFLAVAASAVANYRAAKAALVPLEQLAKVAKAVEAGDHSYRAPSGAARELDVLLDSFARMAQDLAAARAESKEANERLDEGARKRTLELLRADEIVRHETTAHDLARRQLFESQKQEIVGRLTAGIAHDFNNLMTAVIGCCYQVRLRVEHDVEATELLRVIEEIIMQGARITRQLLLFSRPREAQLRPTSLDSLLQRLETGSFRMLGEHVECALDLAADGAWVLIEEGRLEQVVLNLALNARDAMPRGGRVTISTRRQTGGPPDDADGREWVVLCVEDTGCGMTDELKARVFDPFFTTKEIGKGTGLGLAVVKGVVEQCRGKIRVDSRPGAGTKFTLFLPPAVEPAPAAAFAPAEAVILVVEDEPVVRANAVSTLRQAGYLVAEAADAAEAAGVVAALPMRLDVLFTDVELAGGSGWDLASELAAGRPGLGVVLTTGNSERATAPDAPSFEYVLVPKPYTPADLLAVIAEALRSSADAEESARGPQPTLAPEGRPESGERAGPKA